MDPMYVAYFEETEELLQRAEECLIRLENDTSSDDINELFRIVHSIKGSSQMIGFDQIGNLTHKIEDLLDFVRKGRIRPDSEVLRLCFDGLDCVKTMVEAKKTNPDEEIGREIVTVSGKLGEEIGNLLGTHSEAKSRRAENPVGGIVNALKEAKSAAYHRVYISVVFSDDAPMVQASLFMIFNNIKEIGSLEYSNISDEDIFNASADRQITHCVMILNTDLEPCELYPYFEVMYVEHVAIVDISDRTLRERAVPQDRRSLAFFERFFDEYKKIHPLLFRRENVNRAELAEMIREQSDNILAEARRVPVGAVLPDIERFYERCWLLLAEKTKLRQELVHLLRREYMRLLEKVYGHVRGKMIFKIVKARDGHFRQRLNETVERMDKSLVRTLFVDVSGWSAADERALADLIGIKRRFGGAGISVGIIAGVPMNKRLVNVFDSIQSVERFDVYGTELDAVLGGAKTTKRIFFVRYGDMDKYRIMIVDREETAAALQKTLESAGFHLIDVCSDAAEALARFRNQKYHILLADMDMPQMDGIDFLTKVKQYDPLAQVIMMTGHSTLDRAFACLELGANDYVLKPFKDESCITEAVAYSVNKLERWKEAIKETVLRQSEASRSGETS